MRKFFYITVFLLIFLGGVSLGAIFAMPKDTIIDNVKEQLLAATGREAEIADLDLMFWPNIGVELKDVKFANHEQAQSDSMFSVSKLKLAVAVAPLLKKKVKLQNIELVEPQINIEILPNNENSFSFKKKKAVTVEAVAEASTEKEKSFIDSLKYQFGDVEITKAKVNLINKDKLYKFTDVNLTVNYPTLESVFTLEGSFNYKGEVIGTYLSLDDLLALADDKISKGIVRLMYGRSKAEVTGVLAKKAENIDVDIELDVRSVSNLLKLLDKPELIEKVGFSRVKLLGELSAEEDNITIAKADMELDDLKAIGALDIDLGAHPNIFARLTSNKIDVDELMAKFKKGKSAPSKASGKISSKDSDKIDLSALKKFDADIILQTDGLVIDDIDMGRVALTSLLKDGDLNLSIENATIYSGKVTSKFKINSGYGTPAMSVELDAKGVDAKSFLKKFAKFDKISGKLDAVVSIQSVGESKEQLIDNSKGRGTVKFRDGEFKDIDLLKIARLTQDRSKDLNVGEGEGVTKFTSLGGTFTIARGVVTNNDLRMSSPVLNAKAKGTVNLPMKKVKYYVTPTMLASDGKKEGIAIPLKISGRFSNIRVEPDFKSVADELIKDPKTAEEKIKNIKKELKETAKTVKENLKEEIENDPVKALQNFFGTFMQFPEAVGNGGSNKTQQSEEF